MISVTLIVLGGLGSVAFLLWCLYNLCLECSRPRSVKVTAFGSVKPLAKTRLIEFPKSSGRERVPRRVAIP